MSQALPPAIWSRRTATARPPVSEEAIVDAALGLLDDQGLDAVTMRAVAERMGVSAPTIYWHVENKDGLLDRLYNQLCSEVSLPSGGAWQDRLRSLATSIRSVFSAHRDSARIAVGRFPLGPHGLQVTEVALAALADAGLDVEDTAHAAHLFFSYVTSFSYQETVLPASTPTGDRAASLALVEHYLSLIAPRRLPPPHSLRSSPEPSGLDRRFTFGLDRLIRGLTPS